MRGMGQGKELHDVSTRHTGAGRSWRGTLYTNTNALDPDPRAQILQKMVVDTSVILDHLKENAPQIKVIQFAYDIPK